MKLIISAKENGPYIIPGTATYVDEAGQQQITTRTPLALCRCGQSAIKPFCDASHKKTGFKAPVIYLEVEQAE